MRVQRIWAIILQELYFTRRSVEIAFDLPFFSIMSLVVFGLFAKYLDSVQSSLSGRYLLVGILLWEILRVTQYSVSVAALWNIWSRNLSNMFIAPLSMGEYVAAQMISGVIKAFLIFVIVCFLSSALYGFNILAVGGFNLFLFSLNLTLFGWSLGVVILAAIIRYGTRIQAFAWGVIALFQPLTAAFFPLSILPPRFQMLALALPPTYVFEAARASLQDRTINWEYHLVALGENVIFLLASLYLLSYMFKRSKMSGQFARNEQ